MIYLFVLDDSLTSMRFTTRTEELTKCFEPLQKLRVRLWPCRSTSFANGFVSSKIYDKRDDFDSDI